MFELFTSREIWRHWRAIIPQTQTHSSEAFSAACRLLIPLKPIIIQDNNDILSVTVSDGVRFQIYVSKDINLLKFLEKMPEQGKQNHQRV